MSNFDTLLAEYAFNAQTPAEDYLRAVATCLGKPDKDILGLCDDMLADVETIEHLQLFTCDDFRERGLSLLVAKAITRGLSSYSSHGGGNENGNAVSAANSRRAPRKRKPPASRSVRNKPTPRRKAPTTNSSGSVKRKSSKINKGQSKVKANKAGSSKVSSKTSSSRKASTKGSSKVRKGSTSTTNEKDDDDDYDTGDDVDDDGGSKPTPKKKKKKEKKKKKKSPKKKKSSSTTSTSTKTKTKKTKKTKKTSKTSKTKNATTKKATAKTTSTAPAKGGDDSVSTASDSHPRHSQSNLPTPEEISFVTKSWELLQPIRSSFAELFHAQLFRLDPLLKPLFKGDMYAQHDKFIRMWDTMITCLHDLDRTRKTLRGLAVRHVAYNVLPDMYTTFGRALVYTLQRCLADEFTEDVRKAWGKLVGFVVQEMLAAVEHLLVAPSAGKSSNKISHPDALIIKESWKMACETEIPSDTKSDHTFAKLLFKKLFEIAPHTRYLFKNSISHQASKFTYMMSHIVKHIDVLHEPQHASHIEAMGKRHAHYLVVPEHYDMFGDALLRTLEQVLGDVWTGSSRAAWARGYNVLSSMMKAAAETIRDGKKSFKAASVVESRIEGAIQSNSTELSLSGYQFYILPESVFKLTRLTSLRLSYNSIVKLPAEIGGLVNLRYLFLQHNKLAALPRSIGNLSKLKWLNLSNNWIKAIPPEIGNNRSLQQLNVANNMLTTLPGTIGELDVLHTLDLTNNKIRELPWQIGMLKSLSALSVGENKRLNLPPDILGPISSSTKTTRRARKHKGSSSNSSQAFGKDSGSFSSGEFALQQSTAAIQAYLRSSHSCGVITCNRIKLALLGPSGAGKTTLLRALKGLPEDDALLSTNGMEVTEWEVDSKRFPNGPVLLSCQDFGGQEVFYQSHSIFISGRTVYLLVFNMMDCTTSARAVEYWLQNVRTVCQTSAAIVVGTHADCVAKSGGAGMVRPEDIRDILYRNGVDTSMISGYISVASIGKKRVGIPSLKRMIVSCITDLGVLAMLYPKSYFMLAEQLVQLRGIARPPIITYERYLALAEKVGALEYAKEIGRFLHTLGVIIWFCEDDGLGQLIVLDPGWLCQLMAAIVSFTSAGIISSTRGIVTRSQMRTLLAGSPPHFFDTLMLVLEKFDVLLSLGRAWTSPAYNESFLISAFLPPRPPTSVFFRWAGSGFQFAPRVIRSEFIPEGFFPRCIVRLMHLGQPISMWARGVLWRSPYDPSTEVLVTFSRSPHFDITIQAHGKKKPVARVLHYIVDAITNLIASLLPYAHTEQLIPCPHCRDVEEQGPQALNQASSSTEDDAHPRASEQHSATGPRVAGLQSSRGGAATSSPMLERGSMAKRSGAEDAQYGEDGENDSPSDAGVIFSVKEVQQLFISGAQFITCPKGEVAIRVDQLMPEWSLDGLKKIFQSDLELQEEVGKGSFGQVVCAEYKPTRQSFALKLFSTNKSSLDQEISQWEEFVRETRNLLGLSHPAIVSIVGVVARKPTLVLEYLPRGDLYHFLSDANNAVGWRFALQAAKNVAKALHFLHSAFPPVIHRDVRSTNILVADPDASDPSSPCVKLADLGMVLRSASYQNQKDTMVPLRTPEWLAPETLKYYRYTTRTDIYAFGILLSVLVTRMNPFEGDNFKFMYQISDNIIEGRRPPLPIGLPPRLEEIIRQCWAPDEDERPSWDTIFPVLDECLSKCDTYTPLSDMVMPREGSMETTPTTTVVNDINMDPSSVVRLLTDDDYSMLDNLLFNSSEHVELGNFIRSFLLVLPENGLLPFVSWAVDRELDRLSSKQIFDASQLLSSSSVSSLIVRELLRATGAEFIQAKFSTLLAGPSPATVYVKKHVVNVKRLHSLVDQVLDIVLDSISDLPNNGIRLAGAFTRRYQACMAFWPAEKRPKSAEIRILVTSGIIFAHFVCPALTLPTMYGLSRPSKQLQKGLALAVRVLQQITGGGSFASDSYLAGMNGHLDEFRARIEPFAAEICSGATLDLEPLHNASSTDVSDALIYLKSCVTERRVV